MTAVHSVVSPWQFRQPMPVRCMAGPPVTVQFGGDPTGIKRVDECSIGTLDLIRFSL
jgi:hypothetical protein